MLKAYISTNCDLSKVKPEIINPFDAEADLLEKQEQAKQEHLKKEMKHLQMQISRINAEIQQRENEWQREIIKETRGRDGKKEELKALEERLNKQMEVIRWAE